MSKREGTGYTASRSRHVTAQQRSEEAKRAIEEQRTKALWYMYRTSNMDVAEMLGLSPGPALVPMWREFDDYR